MKLKNTIMALSLLSLLAACNNEKDVKGQIRTEEKKQQEALVMEQVDVSAKASSYVYVTENVINVLGESSSQKTVNGNGMSYGCQVDLKSESVDYSIDGGGLILTLYYENGNESYERDANKDVNLNTHRGRWSKVEEDSTKRIETTLTFTKTKVYKHVKCTYHPKA